MGFPWEWWFEQRKTPSPVHIILKKDVTLEKFEGANEVGTAFVINPILADVGKLLDPPKPPGTIEIVVWEGAAIRLDDYDTPQLPLCESRKHTPCKSYGGVVTSFELFEDSYFRVVMSTCLQKTVPFLYIISENGSVVDSLSFPSDRLKPVYVFSWPEVYLAYIPLRPGRYLLVAVSPYLCDGIYSYIVLNPSAKSVGWRLRAAEVACIMYKANVLRGSVLTGKMYKSWPLRAMPYDRAVPIHVPITEKACSL